MAKVLHCGIEVSVFDLESYYYVHFGTNFIWKVVLPFIPSGLKCITIIFSKEVYDIINP